VDTISDTDLGNKQKFNAIAKIYHVQSLANRSYKCNRYFPCGHITIPCAFYGRTVPVIKISLSNHQIQSSHLSNELPCPFERSLMFS